MAQAQLIGLDRDETEVLNQLALGCTDSTAAHRLGISVRTLRRRVRNAMEKLGARSRFQAGMRYERCRADRRPTD